MAGRIFISYRTADGRDKATALARDLGARFGDPQVFLDKDDLAAGMPWSEEIQRTLGGPGGVLLLLVTPQLLAAADAQGQPRIADPNDPVRREVSAALAAGDRIIPLLCDGVDEIATGALPPPFDRLGDYTWRKLRAYDWRGDFERLAEDIEALGYRRVDGAAGVAAAAQASSARRQMIAFVAGSAGTVALAGAIWLGLREKKPVAPPPGPDLGATRPEGVPGTWLTTVASDPPFALVLEREDDRLKLTSVPVGVDDRPDWESYRASWRSLTGTELKRVVYRGRGTIITDPGVPLAIDVAWTLFNEGGDTKIDSGNLHALADADGKTLTGRLWSNGDQAERPVVLKRATR